MPLRLRTDFREREKARGDAGIGKAAALLGFVDGLAVSDVVKIVVVEEVAGGEVSGSEGGGEGDSDRRLDVENLGLSVITKNKAFVQVYGVRVDKM